jgi:hypothetical protein
VPNGQTDSSAQVTHFVMPKMWQDKFSQETPMGTTTRTDNGLNLKGRTRRRGMHCAGPSLAITGMTFWNRAKTAPLRLYKWFDSILSLALQNVENVFSGNLLWLIVATIVY